MSTTISEMTGHTPRPMGSPSKRPTGGFGPAQILQALPGAFRKLDPRAMWHNPVMFIVEIGAALTTVLAIAQPFLSGLQTSGGTTVPLAFTWSIAVWLWLTVVFANLSESVAEGRGKAQADTLRATRTSTVAHLVTNYDEVADAGAERTPMSEVSSGDLRLGDIVVVSAGEPDSGRRRHHLGHRLGRRVGDHRRVGARSCANRAATARP